MSSRYWFALLAIFLCSAALPALQRPATVRYDSRILPASFEVRPDHYSNILPGDYVGTETCAECHQEQYDLWLGHPHRIMNQLPGPDTVLGDFEDARLSLPGGQVTFTTHHDGDRDQPVYRMNVWQDGRLLRRYQVTRTVGSRYIQSYIGKQIEGPEPADHQIREEHKLPWSWRIRMRTWLPGTYFNLCCDEPLADGVPREEGIDLEPSIKPYRAICKNCHNTLPYAYRLFSPPLAGFRDARISAAVDALAAELAEVHGTPPPRARPGTASAVSGFIEMMDPDRHLVSLGIGCESCHLGGREHVENENRIRFLPTSGYTRITPRGQQRPLADDRSDSRTLLGVCSQCHSGNNPLFPNGAAKGNSREALDLQGGFCASQLSCIACHEPHTASPGPSGGPDLAAHADSCVQCHPQYRDRQQAARHSGHAAADNLSCLDCHMPRYTRGVDTLIRSHRIVNPVEMSMVNAGSANACNTCHLDKSTHWTLTQTNRIWNRDYRLATDAPVRDQADLPVGELWLASKDSHLRLMAGQLYARSAGAGRDQLESLIRGLGDSERVNRVFAVHAVCQLLDHPPHQPLPVDIVQTPAIRSRQIEAWLERLRATGDLSDPAQGE